MRALAAAIREASAAIETRYLHVGWSAMFDLPFPPSNNHRTEPFVTREGRLRIRPNRRVTDYFRRVEAALVHQRVPRLRIATSITMALGVHCPPGRRLDLDNVPKLVLDALETSAVLADDYWVGELRIRRELEVGPHGMVSVRLERQS